MSEENMMRTQEKALADAVHAGLHKTILADLKSGIPYNIMCAILEGMSRHERSPEFIEGLIAAKDNTYPLWISRGIASARIGDIAWAALDVCGIEKYEGDDPFALGLLKNKFEDSSPKGERPPECERFEEWKDDIRTYCEENGLSYEKACQMWKSSSKDMLALMCNDRYAVEGALFPAVLYIKRTEDGLQFKQTEYTQQILAP